MILNAADMTPLIAVLQHITRQRKKCNNLFILEFGGAASEGNLAAATLAAAVASTPDPSLVRKSSPASLARPREILSEEEDSRSATRYLSSCLFPATALDEGTARAAGVIAVPRFERRTSPQAGDDTPDSSDGSSKDTSRSVVGQP
mmetsp:Transcript_1194/g.2741  ORF Transcript_1194/g.2741 Transcript_1194/m.2741 type:complete len:146 (-) Transcript_1194:259-696(-)